MTEEILRRKDILERARESVQTEKSNMVNNVQTSFRDDDIYYRLYTQGAYAVDISTKVRKTNPELLPPLNRAPGSGAKKSLYPTYSKRDYELTVSANYAMSKDLLDSKSRYSASDGSSFDIQSEHSEVRFGFAVFESEARRENAGSKYEFKFGEGTCDVSDEIKSIPADLLRERRKNLYRYQTWEPAPNDGKATAARDAIHTIEVGSLELFKQPRAIGYPMFVSPFAEKCDTSGLIFDEDGTVDLEDDNNRAKYHRAMRYRFEVMRLWWKLFHHQYDQVQNEIFIESMGGDNAAINQGVNGQFSEALRSVTDATRPRMILSVIELGREGSLRYGTIYPRFYPSSKFDKDRNRNFFIQDEVGPDDVMYARVRNQYEQNDTQPVQLFESYCWPVVMPAKTRSWLDWVAAATTVTADGKQNVVNDVKDKNLQVYRTMKALFENDLAVDYDALVEEGMTPDLQEYIDELFQNSDMDAKAKSKSFWTLVEVISGDLLDAMPYWANAYLCEDLVSHPEAQSGEAVAEKQLRQEQLKKDLITTEVEIRTKEQSLESMPISDETQESRERTQRELRELGVSRARTQHRLNELTYYHSSSSVLWMPYASQIRTERDKNDADALYSKSWAQECFHRCILSIYDDSWSERYSANTGPMNQVQRGDDGEQIEEGSSIAGELYRQWFAEVYEGLGNNGLALPGQLVTMTNLVARGKPVLNTQPGTVQLQGHAARIIARKSRPESKSVDYVLETQFDFVGTKEEAEAAQRDSRVSSANKWLVTLSDSHIMPFSYNNQYRYGDIVEFKKLGQAYEEKMKAADVKRNNLEWRGEDEENPYRWSVVGSLWSGQDYSLILSRFDGTDDGTNPSRATHLRWPINTQVDANGVELSTLSPLTKEMESADSAISGLGLKTLNVYRERRDGTQVLRKMRPNKFTLVAKASHASDDMDTDERAGNYSSCE